MHDPRRGLADFLGGITPYLDRVGASERVNGKRFLAPGVASERRPPSTA